MTTGTAAPVPAVHSTVAMTTAKPAAAPVPANAPKQQQGGAPIPTAQPITKAKAAKLKSQSIQHSLDAQQSTADDLVDAKELLAIPLTRIYRIQDAERKLFAEGTLRLVSTSSAATQKSHATTAAAAAAEASRVDDLFLLQCGEFIAQLRLDVPCLQMSQLHYVMPTKRPDVHFGIVLSPPADSDAQLTLDALQSFLHDTTLFKQSHVQIKLDEQFAEEQNVIVKHGTGLASKIDAGAVALAANISRNAAKLSQSLDAKSNEMHDKLQPNAVPTQVSTQTKERIHKAQQLSGVAVKVSRALCIGASATASAISNELSAMVKASDAGKQLQAKSNSDARLDIAKQVAASTIVAAVNVSDALFTSGLMLFGGMTSATAKLISKKYGVEAGVAASEAGSVAHNLAQSAVSLKDVGVKGIVKNSIQSTVVTVLSEDGKKELMRVNQEQQSTQINESNAELLGQVVNVIGVENAVKATLAIHQAGHTMQVNTSQSKEVETKSQH